MRGKGGGTAFKAARPRPLGGLRVPKDAAVVPSVAEVGNPSCPSTCARKPLLLPLMLPLLPSEPPPDPDKAVGFKLRDDVL